MGRAGRRSSQRMAPDQKPREAGQRIDKWMWCARITKTRSEAARLIAAGAVRLNSVKVEKAAVVVRRGDVLTVARLGRVGVHRVLGFSERRVGAAVARRLREDL